MTRGSGATGSGITESGITKPRPPIGRAIAVLIVGALTCTLSLSAAAARPSGAADGRPPGAAQSAPQGWAWPLDPRPTVVRAFDPPSRPWLSGHRGVDLAAASGTEVRAPAAGTVVFSGWVVDRPVVTLDHGDGHRSSFEPVVGVVEVGAAMARGAPMGTLVTSEASHCAPASCLHWGVREGEQYVDPLAFIEDRRPSILLPWTDR